jgi:hypothetical protein
VAVKVRLPFTNSGLRKLSGLGWGLSDELSKWLCDLEDLERYAHENVRVAVYNDLQEMEFLFYSEEAAAMFKLAWCGV